MALEGDKAGSLPERRVDDVERFARVQLGESAEQRLARSERTIHGCPARMEVSLGGQRGFLDPGSVLDTRAPSRPERDHMNRMSAADQGARQRVPLTGDSVAS